MRLPTIRPGPGFDPVLLIGTGLVLFGLCAALFTATHEFPMIGWLGIGVMLARVT